MVLALLVVGASFAGTGGCLGMPLDYRCEDNGTEDWPCSERLIPGEPYSEGQCRPADGCHLAPGCRRVDCEPLKQIQCEAIPRCKWTSDTTYPGCHWSFSAGATDPCVPLGEAQCGADPSCVWDVACFGEPKRCANIHDEAACGAVSHCTWQPVRNM